MYVASAVGHVLYLDVVSITVGCVYIMYSAELSKLPQELELELGHLFE